MTKTLSKVHYTAVPRQKDLRDIAALSLSNYTIYIQSMSSNDMPSEPSQTQAGVDNSFVCLLQRLTDFQCSIIQVTCIERF